MVFLGYYGVMYFMGVIWNDDVMLVMNNYVIHFLVISNSVLCDICGIMGLSIMYSKSAQLPFYS